MLAHPTLDHLHALGLYGLAKGFKELEHRPEARGLDHAEWLGLLVEYELTLRRQKQFETRARVAKLRHPASVEDVNYQSPRGLDRALFLKLAACDGIAERRNLLITGASGLGKSWLACALGHKACRENMSVLYTRMPRLFADLAIARGDARYARLLRSLARVKLLILPARFPSTAGTTLLGSRRFHDASLFDRLVRRTLALSTTAWSGDSEICQGIPLASCVPVSHPFRSQSNMTCGVMPMAAAAPWTE